MFFHLQLYQDNIKYNYLNTYVIENHKMLLMLYHDNIILKYIIC